MAEEFDNHSVGTFVKGAQQFGKAHPGLSETQAALGGALMGMMKALLECPKCPGYYRVPITQNDEGKWEVEAPFGPMRYIYCHKCGGVWGKEE